MASTDKSSDWRNRAVLTQQLPSTFLALETDRKQQEQADEQAAIALQHQLTNAGFHPPNSTGRLSITVAQAKLVKNYGVARMDPYVRLRVGHNVYETDTDANGAKNPRWNRVIQCYLPRGVDVIGIEIYDECAFTMDELIAWAHIPISPAVFKGDTVDDWYPLNGKQGDGKEGSINLVMSLTHLPTAQATVPNVVMVPYGVYPHAFPPVTYQLPPQEQPRPPAVQLTDEELKPVYDMFPNLDQETVKAVVLANHGNKDAAVNALLQMCE